MLSEYDVKNIKKMKNHWYSFKYERNMPKYQGVISPHWITIVKREEMIEKLFLYCEKLIKDDQ